MPKEKRHLPDFTWKAGWLELEEAIMEFLSDLIFNGAHDKGILKHLRDRNTIEEFLEGHCKAPLEEIMNLVEQRKQDNIKAQKTSAAPSSPTAANTSTSTSVTAPSSSTTSQTGMA